MFTQSAHSWCTLKPGEPGFAFHNGIVVMHRASFEISPDCPKEYRMIIADCINRGWLQPVAHMRDVELTMDRLRS